MISATLRARFDRVFQAAVGEAEIFAPVELQDLGGGGGFAGANFRRAVRRGFAAGHIEHADLQPFGFESQQRAPHAQLGVVGMRGDDEQVEHREKSDGRRQKGK